MNNTDKEYTDSQHEDAWARWQAARPDIDLVSAVAPDGTPLFDVGDLIVVERHSILLKGHPWMNTRTYKVVSFGSNGIVNLHEEDMQQSSVCSTRDVYTRIFFAE
jgi:hypothetical protein